MTDQIVITEKSSQAKDVRAAVGSRYGAVLPAEGHLLDLCEPEDVNPAWKRWAAVLLRPEGLYGTKPAPGGNKAAKLKAIREALRTAKRVWLATDCDREGQLIGQEILEHCGYRGEVLRVLFTAQDAQTIREAFGRARPNGEHARLYAAAVARRQADQIYNLSLTRTATVTLGRGAPGVLGVGRVKTPTLAIVCKRELEIRDFVPRTYFEVVAAAHARGGVFRMRHAPKERVLTRADAEAVATSARDFEGPLGVRVEDKRQRPPGLHDLPSLQKLCSARFGWSASRTLEVAQELYDGAGKTIITYPRAEVRYLPESALADVPKIVAGLQAGKSYGAISVPSPPVLRTGRNGSFHDKGLEGESHHAVIPNVNRIGDVGTIWRRLSGDEKKLFDAVARSYLASVMPDYRYRQTTVALGVHGFEFRATGRQPIEPGWRDAFPEWRPAEEKGEAAQVLPALRNGEVARLRDPKIEDKETRPPPRYKEGTLVEAMQNAWCFVEDDLLRDRLKEAKGIGTPATRAEIIAGLRNQGLLLIAHRQHLVPTERGLALFGVLQRADPALVDPGVTAELECLLDDVVLGRQKMMAAIDAVCDAARRIIVRLRNGSVAGETVALGKALGSGSGGGDRPPTVAMKRFAASLAKRKGIKPAAGYTRSATVCRAFLDRHAPARAAGDTVEESTGAAASRSPSAAQVSLAEAIAREKNVGVPDEARACSTTMSKWIDANSGPKAVKGRKAPARNARGPAATKRTMQARMPRKSQSRNAAGGAVQSGSARTDSETDTPLRIPYGNKDVALQLGARYAPTGWYAPPGVNLAAFRKRGWL